jgi:hypothetical protein
MANKTDITVGAAANASVINAPDSQLDAAIGNLATLGTTSKTLIGAINELLANYGALSGLSTDVKTTLVAAVNEVDAHVDLNTIAATAAQTAADIANLGAVLANAAAAAAQLTGNLVTAEVVAARAAYADLNTRLASIAVAGGNIATTAHGLQTAGTTSLYVYSTTGFVTNCWIVYTLAAGGFEYRQATVADGTHLTVAAISGNVSDATVISMVTPLEIAAAGGYNTFSDRLDGIDKLPAIGRVASAATIGQTHIHMRTPTDTFAANQLWLAIDPYTSECEIRKVTIVAGNQLDFGTALAYNHSAGDAVLVLADPTANVKWFGALGDGVATDGPAIQRAIDQLLIETGGQVYFPRGTYLTAAPLVIYTATRLQGESRSNTIIKLKGASNCDIIQSYNWAAQWAAMSYATSPHDFRIEHLTLDGNKTNQTTGGAGIRLYACGWQIYDVEIHDCWSHGIWSSFLPSGSLPTGGTLEARVTDVTIHGCGGHGWWYRGPTDSKIEQLVCWGCGNNSGLHVTNGNDTNDGICGATVGCGLVLDASHPTVAPYTLYGGSAGITYFHGYSNFGHDMWIKPGGYCKAQLIEVGAYQHGLYIQRDGCEFGEISAYGSNRVLNGWANVYVGASNCHFGKVYTSQRYYNTTLDENTSGGYGVFINGDHNSIGLLKAWGYGIGNAANGTFAAKSAGARTSVGCVIAGNYNVIAGGELWEFDQSSSVGLDSGNGSARIYNDIRLVINNCVTCWKNNHGTASHECKYDLELYALDTQSLFSGNAPAYDGDTWSTGGEPALVTDQWKIIGRLYNGANYYKYMTPYMAWISVDLTSVVERVVTLHHRQLTTPDVRGITWSFTKLSNAYATQVKYLNITAVGADTATITFNLTAAEAGGTGYLLIRFGITP